MSASMKQQPKFSPNHPCRQDCKERTAECRRSCERYKEYEAKKLAEYKERAEARELDDIHSEMHRKRTKEGCFLGSQAKTILAIDPGNVMSAYCLMDSEYKPLDKGKVLNADLLAYIEEHAAGIDVLVVEMIASYGMPVGAEVFETCVMIGMIEHLADQRHIPHERVFRKEEKLYICLDSRAKDANIRHALIDRFAVFDKQRGTGTKKRPDYFYGFAADMWAAFAVGTVYLDKQHEEALRSQTNA